MGKKFFLPINNEIYFIFISILLLCSPFDGDIYKTINILKVKFAFNLKDYIRNTSNIYLLPQKMYISFHLESSNN